MKKFIRVCLSLDVETTAIITESAHALETSNSNIVKQSVKMLYEALKNSGNL